MSGPTDPAEAHFDKGLWAFDGKSWHKQVPVWGYSEIYGEEIEDVDADAGTNQLLGSEVPPGEVWIVQAAQARDRDHIPTTITVQGHVNLQFMVLRQEATPAAAAWVYWTGLLTLSYGDRVQADIAGCTAGDHIEFRACGYKMKLDL